MIIQCVASPHFGGGTILVRSSSTWRGVVPSVKTETMRNAKNVRIDCQRRLLESGRHHDAGRFSPDPCERLQSSRSRGTCPPKRSTTSRAHAMMFLAFMRKKPVDLMIFSTSACRARASFSGVGYLAKSAGVVIFTRASVVCAERITATSSWNSLSILERGHGVRINPLENREFLDRYATRNLLLRKRNARHGAVLFWQRHADFRRASPDRRARARRPT